MGLSDQPRRGLSIPAGKHSYDDEVNLQKTEMLTVTFKCTIDGRSSSAWCHIRMVILRSWKPHATSHGTTGLGLAALQMRGQAVRLTGVYPAGVPHLLHPLVCPLSSRASTRVVEGTRSGTPPAAGVGFETILRGIRSLLAWKLR
jgi:hypothetical protein